MESYSIIAEQLTMLPNGDLNINDEEHIDKGERCSIIVTPNEMMKMKFFNTLELHETYWQSRIEGGDPVNGIVNDILRAQPYRRFKILVSGNYAVDFY